MSRLTLVWLLVVMGVVSGCETAVSSPTPTATAAPTLTPTPRPTALIGAEPVQRVFNSPAFGIHTSFWWKPDVAQRDIQLVQEMGFDWVKQKFPWREIEGAQKGEYDWYRPDLLVDMVEEAELNLVARLDQQPLWSVRALPDAEITPSQPPVDYADYGDYCGAVAERYRGRIAAYQVWNEPNLAREWGGKTPDPAAYTDLLRVCYRAIKAADPAAIVISAGLAPTGTGPPLAMPDDAFLQGMYDAGAAAYYDVLGLHAPGFKAPPEWDPAQITEHEGYGNGRWFAFRHVEDMRAIMVANGDSHKQVAILEMGWILEQEIHESYSWHGVTAEQQADYLVRAYQYAAEHWQPWIGLMTTVYIADYYWEPETHEQWWWSIVLPDGTPRPAYEALREMDKSIGQ